MVPEALLYASGFMHKDGQLESDNPISASLGPSFLFRQRTGKKRVQYKDSQ
jgi:hypothetical protein